MNRLLGRFRMLVPPVSFVILYVIVYLLCNLPILIWLRGGNQGEIPANLTYARRMALIFGLVVYGAYRAFAFHPYFRLGYRRWLETTPWDWRKPLPVGPIHPVPEDVVIIAAMSAAAWWFRDFEPFATFCIPLGAYLLAISLSMPSTGAWGFHIVVIFLVGLALRLWEMQEWAYTSAILGALVFGLIGLGRSLRSWPWSAGMPDVDPQKLEAMMNNPSAAQNQLGWPYDRLGPRRDGPPTWRNTADAFFGCVLTAWWFYCLLGLAPWQGRGPIAAMVIMYATLFTLIHRVTRYMMGYASPLSVGARIVRFRFIIPSYDQVFAAPLAAVFCVSAGPWMLHKLDLEWDAVAAITLGLAEIALYLGGPDLRRWQLTAKHRVVPAIGASAKTKGGFIQVG